MKYKHLIRIVTTVALVAIVSVLYVKHIYQFLHMNRKVKPDILVVEGWMNDKSLEAAKEEFLDNHYGLIITTGFSYFEGWGIYMNGKLVFDLENKINTKQDNKYTVSIVARGDKAAGTNAHFVLLADSLIIGNDFVDSRQKTFTYEYISDTPPVTIQVLYDNDAYTGYEDRNLYVFSVLVNGQTFMADNPSVSHYSHNQGSYTFEGRLSKNASDRAAGYLINAGIPSELVVPVETLTRKKSRTYSTARDVKIWLDNNLTGENRTVTVVTQGVHARRSFYSFNKILEGNYTTGVVSLPEHDINYFNWWQCPEGWGRVLYETIGLIYSFLIL